MTAAPNEGFARAEALLLEHRRLMVQARALLARSTTQTERLAMVDELISLIDGLGVEKRALGARIHRGRAANVAVSAYGRAMATRR
ncbi:hypothetical protein J2848_004954 [Azospirillum lipoferum]|uniref:Flagellar protein FlgN n=1 Tax=Azospirillum lipoferum TaxID=193 RepID=A0A5A9GLH7_AZOLI|nr:MULTISPECIES: hypothetical protein [Azospirillum]KAA0594504.1 hypothetical protein FZ942_20820 [Azospirillum lipoferum]MCP1613258.1 hypothetical protein [Azospirillum lipoferum]MDW5531457.1 hypothetical protein [Azospirillum sp. NL1]